MAKATPVKRKKRCPELDLPAVLNQAFIDYMGRTMSKVSTSQLNKISQTTQVAGAEIAEILASIDDDKARAV